MKRRTSPSHPTACLRASTSPQLSQNFLNLAHSSCCDSFITPSSSWCWYFSCIRKTHMEKSVAGKAMSALTRISSMISTLALSGDSRYSFRMARFASGSYVFCDSCSCRCSSNSGKMSTW